MISYLEFGVCIGCIVFGGIVCAWMMYCPGRIHSGRKFSRRLDQFRREARESPYGFTETKKKRDRG